MFDVAIIGCGIAGAAAAFTLSQYRLSVVVLERGNDIATGATKANSAIIHAGYDPQPGTLMARLNVRGNELTAKLCEDLSIPYKQIGSIVLAFSEDEMATVRSLYARGVQNGVPGMKILSGEEVRKMEPMVSEAVIGALYAPTAGIVNPWEYALALAETAVRNGAEVRLQSEVTGIRRENGAYLLDTAAGTVEARYVVNAAGVDSDTIHDMVAPHAFNISPSRGEYYLMDKTEGSRASHVLFQCPNKDGKGVLVSPTVHGNLIVGPNATPSENAHRVNTSAGGLSFVRDKACKSVPSINYRNSIRNFAGIRANSDSDDFIIGVAAENFIDLAGIKSPGLSSAPAIAEEAVRLLSECGLKMVKKDHPIVTREKLRFRDLPEAQKREAFAKNPLYGRVICRCETITEGEIVEAIHSPIPPCSIDGVKRRAGTGMGRCQGGFCGPRVHEILARELKVPMEDILMDQSGTYILTDRTKEGGR